ncbi:hypothetical protein [Parachitinimonas caeni]|uniref:Uncharacterized protein n=1 Tax=Parachitinimonas caeni TaxID=3031301 RepID=A0ABT7DYE2_9NEIS|nr:hypothetical protein [Parachitinimonas caeni]MDK2125085.1 hypothetical protein [Parachitinimonas caeni]
MTELSGANVWNLLWDLSLVGVSLLLFFMIHHLLKSAQRSSPQVIPPSAAKSDSHGDGNPPN